MSTSAGLKAVTRRWRSLVNRPFPDAAPAQAALLSSRSHVVDSSPSVFSCHRSTRGLLLDVEELTGEFPGAHWPRRPGEFTPRDLPGVLVLVRPSQPAQRTDSPSHPAHRLCSAGMPALSRTSAREERMFHSLSSKRMIAMIVAVVVGMGCAASRQPPVQA